MRTVMNMIANPFVQPELFDVVYAADQPNPGVAKVTGAATLYKWDKKDGPGAAGAYMTFRGLDLSEFRIECQLWTEAHLEAWPFWAGLWAWDPVKRKAEPLRVVHPLLLERNIETVAAKTVPQLTYMGGGLWKGEINCIEWRPPPKKNVVQSPAAVRGAPSVLTERQTQIQQLTQELTNLQQSNRKQ